MPPSSEMASFQSHSLPPCYLLPHSPQGYYKDTVEFYFEDRNQCKNFWKKCVEHHTFFRCSRSSYGAKDRERTRILSRGSSFR